MRKDKWKIIGRGRNGWHAGNDDTSLSGAYAEADGDRLAQDAVNGALVYDAKNASPDHFITLVMSGPMVDTKLAPNQIDRFGDHDAARVMLPGLSGGFDTMVEAVLDGKRPGSLDRVGTAVYEVLLRTVPGVRIGRVKGGAIVWETK